MNAVCCHLLIPRRTRRIRKTEKANTFGGVQVFAVHIQRNICHSVSPVKGLQIGGKLVHIAQLVIDRVAFW